MARKPDIQYVTQFYSYGSEAKVLELKPAKKQQKSVLPKAVPQQKICIAVDPIAWAGIAVAVVMVILMAVSVQNYLDMCAEHDAMLEYVVTLQNTKVETEQEYRGMYDLEDIREKALALGMVPMENAEVVMISPLMPEPKPEQPWWDDIVWFMKGLFA